MEKLLITGATGYIGRFLTRRLLEDGYSVSLLTRDKHKVPNEFKTKGCKIYQGDIKNKDTLKDIEEVDGIFHLAADKTINGDREILWRANVLGTKNLLDLSLKLGVKKFIFASSIEAVGPASLAALPVDETFPPKPANPYGESKLDAEELVNEYHKKDSLNTVVARIGTVYGLGIPFIFPIVESLLSKDKFSQMSYPFYDRYIHLIYITDLIELLIRCYVLPVINGKTYFLVGNNYIKFKELTKLIAFFIGKDLFFIDENKPLEGPVHMAYANKKAREELGFSPLVDIEKGIGRTIIWFFQNGYLPIKTGLKQRLRNYVRSFVK